MMSAVQLLSLGIIGEYLARIFQEVKGRPTFLIARIEQQHRSKDNEPATSASAASQTDQTRDRSALA
jgi:hypothetical protein